MSARAVCPCGWTGGPYTTIARAEAMAAKHVCKTGRCDGVRRATRHHRCARCGHEATYPDAGAKEARKFFARHSCRKREEAMLRAAIREERMAAIDRTPKPCLHKVADHQHGTRACYVLDKCRCLPCSEANVEAENWRERQKAYGRYNKFVDARPVREHVQSLMDAGMGLKRVAKITGVSTGTLSKLIYGVYRSTGTGGGRNGPGDRVRGPSRRVLRSTAEKLYALDPDWTGQPLQLAEGACVDGHDTRLKLRSLVALGYSMSGLGQRLGITNIHKTVHGTANGRPGDALVQLSTARAVEALFEELSMALPVESSRQERQIASRSRHYAQEHDWKPPLALEDLDSDARAPEVDALDEAAILRRLSGDRGVRLTKPERAEVVRRARASGMSGNQIERDLGIGKPSERYPRRTEAAPTTKEKTA